MLSKDIEIVPVRDLSYEDAEKEVIECLENAGKRGVFISEIVNKLKLDIGLVADIVYKWRDQMCKNSCEEDGFIGYTSYSCPVTTCKYNNYLVR